MASSPKGGSRFRDRENVRHAVLLVGDAAPVCCAATLARAQSQEIDELKRKDIRRAHGAQQSFNSLKFCSEPNGTSSYFPDAQSHPQSGRIFLLRIYNPAKRRPWTLEAAKERWEEVKKQARDDTRKCELVASFPRLEKRLQELQAVADADKKE